jgi:lysozyme family protein
VTVDGIIGPKTINAIAKNLNVQIASTQIETIKNIQKKINVTVDGILGPKSLTAIKNYLFKDNLIETYINKPIKFSKVDYKTKTIKQSEVRTNNSIFGKAGDESVLISVPVPENYPLKYDGKRVKTIRIHKLVADRLEAALKDIINHYGEDIEKVAPGACVYDGSYYFRNTRNGSSQSIHSWGLAIDFDASNNQLKTKSPYARLSQDIYKPFFDILEHHGFASLGRRSDCDWMHVQATLWG